VNQQNAVCKLSDISNGELKEVKVGETPVLLARVEDKCYALAAHCTHYGAPLADGYLSGDRIVCPWHHACFNARNGALEEPPALDSLAAYPIRIDGEDIFVEMPEDAADRRTPDLTAPDPAADSRTFVIIGGGAAGYTAAQTLREDGFAGRIVMITPEDHLPYDRPNLSKDYLQGQAEPEWMPLRSDDFYAEHGIEVVRDKVKTVTRDQKDIIFNGGKTLGFDSLLIATGGVPRMLDISGSDLANIFVLRSFDSADAIISAAERSQNVAVIGASFIAMEAASSLTKRGKHVTVIAPDKVPFERTLGPEIGKFFQTLHEKNGVTFRLGSGVAGFSGDGRVEKVLLSSGDDVEADLVIVGIGVRPSTDFMVGFDLQNDGGVIADGNLRISDDIYAAGDIVHFPDARTGELSRIEHWRTAMQLGRVAAHNMAGRTTTFEGVPFFWTTQFDATLNYVGHAAGWDRAIVHGEIDGQDFLVFYIKDDAIKAVAGMNRDRELAVWEERFRLGNVPSPADLDSELSANAAS
jgi:NADPH-dependent 2,4-dienoyl-CoA reductase/sulfur reductase-like enzyme/nitrite reductase/ring-hydroxylating ferredoxin subunit